MKQSELDKNLRAVAKAQAKTRGWKSVGGMPYWQSGPLLFTLVLSASAKERSFFASLRFKWLALDNMLWRVLDMESNENEPFSLHANGAFALAGTELLSHHQKVPDWEGPALEDQVAQVAQMANEIALETTRLVSTLDEYIDFIKQKHAALMARSPCAVVTTWAEELLAAMVAGNVVAARQIAAARVAECDSGGYVSGGVSLYQRVLMLLDLPPNNSCMDSPCK
jgi:hypothetical protein